MFFVKEKAYLNQYLGAVRSSFISLVLSSPCHWTEGENETETASDYFGRRKASAVFTLFFFSKYTEFVSVSL